MVGTQRALASALFEIGAVKFGAFRLKLHDKKPDAPLSPIYIDLRLLRSFPKTMGVAAGAYAHIAQALKFDCYADVPTAATPLTAVLAYMTGIPMISPRIEKKEHGTGSSIDGSFRQGQVALLVDDLITQAESKLEVIGALENNGIVVRDVVVLVDREQGGIRELKNRGYGCWAVLKLGSILTFYKDEGMITEEQFARTSEYLALTNSEK